MCYLARRVFLAVPLFSAGWNACPSPGSPFSFNNYSQVPIHTSYWIILPVDSCHGTREQAAVQWALGLNKVLNLTHPSERKKTYCAAFCASLALLAGSGNSASCNGGKAWKEWRTDNEVRVDVVRLIYFYLGKHDFFFGSSLLRNQG